jgi:hypothetical protein
MSDQMLTTRASKECAVNGADAQTDEIGLKDTQIATRRRQDAEE